MSLKIINIKSYHSFIILIIVTIEFQDIKSQYNFNKNEKLYKEIFIKYNKTNEKFSELSNKINEIKLNFLLKSKFRQLIKKYQNSEKHFNDLNNEIKINIYNQSEFADELFKFQDILENLDNDINELNNSYNFYNSVKRNILNLILAFFLVLVVSIIGFLLIAIVIYYFFIFRNKFQLSREEGIKDFKVKKRKKYRNRYNSDEIKNDNTSGDELRIKRNINKKKK